MVVPLLRLEAHRGVILEPSPKGLDGGGAAFASALVDPRDGRTYLFYSAAKDKGWKRSSVAVAVSDDGVTFAKNKEPMIRMGMESVSPSVFVMNGVYWMAFAFRPGGARGRRLGIAKAAEPLGPWEFVGEVIHPQRSWEGSSIDLGPSVVKLGNGRIMLFYSNVTNSTLRNLLFGTKLLIRRIGALTIETEGKVSTIKREEPSPLGHLNGPRGAWNESLFCPGHIEIHGMHCLLPATSTYSVGFPHKQYVGFVQDSSPLFNTKPISSVLIDGPSEKSKIIPGTDEIALDTPCPLLRGDKVWLYFAVMNRSDGLWKTALATFEIDG